MTTEDGFLRKLLDNPADDTARLVLADWLEEQGTDDARAKAEFLRAQHLFHTMPGNGRKKKPVRKRLAALAAGLAPGWLAVVSKLKVEQCGAKRDEADRSRRMPIPFEFVCDKGWDELRATDDRSVRFCDGCRRNVFFCDTIMAAREHANRGRCVAVDVGVERRPWDLGVGPPRQLLGKVLPIRPDPVSAFRERQRQERDRRPDGG